MSALDMPVNGPAAGQSVDKVLLRLGFSAFALAFVLPGHYPPWMSFELQLMAAFGFACALPALYRREPHRRLQPGLLGWTALVLVPLPVIQLATGQIRFVADAILPVLYLSGLALCIIGGRTAAPATKREVGDLLLMALVAAAGVSAAMAWSQWLQQYFIPMTNGSAPGTRVHANLGQPNHLATLLALGCVGVLLAHARGVLGGGTTALVIAFFSSSIVMTQSRTGWLAVVLICAWTWAFRNTQTRPAKSWALLVWLAGFALLVVAWDPLNTYLFPLPISLSDRMDAGSRLVHWASLWDAALAKPWFGYGWNQVGLAQLATAIDHPPTGEMLTNSHNTALDLVLWCGLPIGVTAVAMVLFWFVRRMQAGLDERRSFLMLVFLLLGAHALVEYPLDYTYFLLPWGLAIGLIDEPARPGGKALLPRAAVAGIYVLTVLTSAWVAIEYLRIDSATREARLTLTLGQHGSEPLPPPPQVVLLDGPRELHRLAITQARAGMTATELEWMKTVTDRFPTPPLLLRDALAAGLNGRPDHALLRLAQLCAIHRPARCREAQEQWSALSQQHHLPQPPSWPSRGGAPGS